MRVAVVTGGARRIGATIVNSLIDDGWAVIVHCNRSLTQARQLIQRGEGAIVSGDLSNDEDLFRIIEEIHDHELVAKAGGIDLLVHNASIYNQEDFSTVTPQELRRFSSIHLDAPFFITQGLVPKLKAKKGCVIGMVDTSWNHAWEELAHYTSTKAALRQLLVNLAGELGSRYPCKWNCTRGNLSCCMGKRKIRGSPQASTTWACWQTRRYRTCREIPLRSGIHYRFRPSSGRWLVVNLIGAGVRFELTNTS